MGIALCSTLSMSWPVRLFDFEAHDAMIFAVPFTFNKWLCSKTCQHGNEMVFHSPIDLLTISTMPIDTFNIREGWRFTSIARAKEAFLEGKDVPQWQRPF